MLNNGLGRHDAARDAARRAFERDPVGHGPLVVPELAEAASRTGEVALVRDVARTAHEMLDTMGIEAFAERARRELLATGESARKRTVETRDELTAQEALIARLARDGLSNPDIGTRLFISPRTAKYHLRKVFTKLEVSSRNELAGVLTSEPVTAQQLKTHPESASALPG